MNRHSPRSIHLACVMLLLTAPGVVAHGDPAGGTAATAAPASAAIPEADLLQPEELARTLRSSSAQKPLILQVGSRVLFEQAHIPGAEYIGAGGQEAGRQALSARVRDLKPDQPLVIYCGCCPWTKCPNIRPAYEQLHELGFTRVKVLYLADNFGTDWVDREYPVARGN